MESGAVGEGVSEGRGGGGDYGMAPTSLQYWGGECRVFADKADMACTKRESPWRVR